MKKSFLLIVILMLAVQVNASITIQAIDEAYQRGELNADQMILNKIYAMFDPQQVDVQFRAGETELLKCGTPIMIQYEALEASLEPATVEIVEGYLNPQNDGLRSTYDSPGGHFRFTYFTSGTGAVSATDSDVNGIPDYVEWAASYLDNVWAMEVDAAGFAGPNHVGGDYLCYLLHQKKKQKVELSFHKNH